MPDSLMAAMHRTLDACVFNTLVCIGHA
jgi:hypothetical protein